jgi:hypothetical protein
VDGIGLSRFDALMSEKTTLERAFELARSGECEALWQVRLRLTAEGYQGVNTQTSGKALALQINRLCREARGVRS